MVSGVDVACLDGISRRLSSGIGSGFSFAAGPAYEEWNFISGEATL